jgi:hypothetical protein
LPAGNRAQNRGGRDAAAQLRAKASTIATITAVERYEVVAEAGVEELAPAR